jgi:hypothetical protein
LLVEELALARDVAAIAFGGDVLAQRRGERGPPARCGASNSPLTLPGDDLAAERGLDRDLEQMAGDEVLEALAELAAPGLGGGAVDDHAEGVDRLAAGQAVHPDEVAVAVADLVIFEAGWSHRWTRPLVVPCQAHSDWR